VVYEERDRLVEGATAEADVAQPAQALLVEPNL